MRCCVVPFTCALPFTCSLKLLSEFRFIVVGVCVLVVWVACAARMAVCMWLRAHGVRMALFSYMFRVVLFCVVLSVVQYIDCMRLLCIVASLLCCADTCCIDLMRCLFVLLCCALRVFVRIIALFALL